MDLYQVSLTARATGPGLHLRVCFDDQELFNNIVDDTVVITGYVPYDNNASHTLLIELSKKLQEYTILNNAGEIISDRLIEITSVTIDDIDVTNLFYDQAKYTHNFNSTGEETTQKFYRYMGCNGIVRLDLLGPVYNWMLENT